MASSLRRQVDALRRASTGTSVGHIQRKKGKPSLLLTPDQAADLDLATVREAAVVSLKRLEALDTDLSPFQDSLLSKEGESTHRELQTAEFNNRLNKSIEAFLLRISPHMSSREAHLCVEYLIRHYKIYQYNVDAIMRCFLPWHDTVAFARMVQLLDLKGSRWDFLISVHRTGSPLPRKALARRCAGNHGLLRFICAAAKISAGVAGRYSEGNDSSNHQESLVSEAKAAGQAKLFSFYAAVVVEALESLVTVNEAVLRVLLPDVLHGLSATICPEYQMASYMILSAIVGKTSLAPKASDAALSALILKPCRGDLAPSLLCAILLVQSQAWSTSKSGGGAADTGRSMPKAAFRKLSSTVSVPVILAELSFNYDAQPFLWFLLRSYVDNLAGKDGKHGASLCRLCTHHGWPEMSLPRLIRRLVDRMLKEYLSIACEAEEAGEGDAEKNRKALAMASETQTVLRVLGQRYPKEVDATVSKVNRYLSNLSATAKDEEDKIDIQRATFRENALSTLLALTFAGADDVQRVPLKVGFMDDAKDSQSQDMVHASVITALDHPSPDIRERATEQITRSLRAAVRTGTSKQPELSNEQLEELGPAMMRRVHDEHPKVVSSVAGNDVFWRQVLLQRPLTNPGALGLKVSTLGVETSPAAVALSIRAVAMTWIGRMCERRPKHPVGDSCKVVLSLLRLLSRTATAAVTAVDFSIHLDGVAGRTANRGIAGGCMPCIMGLVVECLPGPHMMQWAKHARESSPDSSKKVHQDNLQAMKKGLTDIGREAVKVMRSLPGLSRPLGIFAVALEQALGRKEGNRNAFNTGNTLEALCEHVCVALGDALKSVAKGEIQALVECLGRGGRWLLMEGLFRAVSIQTKGDQVVSTSSELCETLAKMAMTMLFESFDRTQSPGGLMERGSPLADIFRYLGSCVGSLPASEKPSSLFAVDHLSKKKPAIMSSAKVLTTPDAGDDDLVPSPSAGDVLSAVLGVATPTFEADHAKTSILETISVVVLQAREGYRPIYLLVALFIAGAHSSDIRTVTVAARALYFAATLVKAAAEAKVEKGVVLPVTAEEIVAVAPVGVIALTSKHQELRDMGSLFISSLAGYPSTRTGSPSTSKDAEATFGISDGEIFPLDEAEEDEAVDLASPLCPPSVSVVISFCGALKLSLDSADDEIGEKLDSLLGDGATRAARDSTNFPDGARREMGRYIVAWGARLARRDPKPAGAMLERVPWANPALRECCMSLVRSWFDRGNAPTEVDGIRLSKFLLSTMLRWREAPEAGVTTPTGDTLAICHVPALAGASPSLATEVECLLLKALRTPGQTRTLAMEAISSFEGDLGNEAQRIAILKALVEASVGGVDLEVVLDATNALPVTSEHAGKLVQVLLQDRVVKASVGKEIGGKLSSPEIHGRGWVRVFAGLVELIQALTPRFTKKYGKNRHVLNGSRDPTTGRKTSGTSWTNESLAELVAPLFEAIPVLLAVCDGGGLEQSSGLTSDDAASDASAEYALWLTMDVLANVLMSQYDIYADMPRAGTIRHDAAKDARHVLRCIRENPSPQTRNSALSLLSVMTVIHPAAMASCLSEMLSTVGDIAVAESSHGMVSGGQVALRHTQRVIQSMIPSLRVHGTSVGIRAHQVVKVFVDALTTAPVHTRRALFGTLVDALGDSCLAISSCLLLVKASSATVQPKRPAHGVGFDVERFEFIHQMCHISGARSQVETMMKLVQCCHRMSVVLGHRSGELSHQAYEEALDTLVGDKVKKRGDKLLMLLPLVGETESASHATKSFMSLDVSALLASFGYGKPRKKALPKNPSVTVDIFLEDVLLFVRMHLLSRPFLTSAATTVPMGSSGDESSVEADLQEAFLLLCEELLLLLKTLGACESVQSSTTAKDGAVGWKSLQAGAFSVLEALQSLLSMPSFVAVIHELLLHEDAHLRRKALQMFSDRLVPSEGSGPMRISAGEEALFIEMLPSLRRVMIGVRNAKSASEAEDESGVWSNVDDVVDESDVNRQTAVLALDVLARALGRGHASQFLKVLEDVTHVVAGTGPGALPCVPESGADKRLSLRSSAFLLVATLCAVLGPRAFPHLRCFFPSILDALERQEQSSNSQDARNSLQASEAPKVSTNERHEGRGKYGLLWTSALASVGTIAASLPTFLSPYLRRILAVVLSPSGLEEDGGGGTGVAAKKEAADRVLSLMAAGLESRLLVPAVCDSYDDCIRVEDASAGEGRAARLVARLLTYVQEVVACMDKTTASAALPRLTRLLTQTMDFRRLYGIKGDEDDCASELVDAKVAASIVALVMKVSEVELRPLFLRLCEWKEGSLTGDEDTEMSRLDRRISFYRVLDELGAVLKSIFTPYFAHVVAGCREDLEAVYKMAEDTSAEDGVMPKRKLLGEGKKSRKRRNRGEEMRDWSSSNVTRDVRHRRLCIARLVLSSLRRCFQFDRSGFVDKSRFEDLMPVIVAQLECVGVSEQTNIASYRRHAEELVGPCLAQLAVACAKDALWKALANALLMRTRSDKAGVRVGALVALRQCFEAVGEEFLALLPECLPFMSELLEDRHPEVERECRTLIKYIEGALGEPIDSYLS